ncbi:MAG TPA: hypothetical protein VGJ46_09905, partial [Candidatus Limnocylindrales bacterium]
MTESNEPTAGNLLQGDADQRAPTTLADERLPAGAQFSARLRGPDLLRIGVVLGAFAILLVSAALTLAASPSPAASPSASGQPNPNNGNGGAPGVGRRSPGFFAGPGILGWPGFRGERGFGGFAFGPITITSIDGSKISLKTVDGWTRTITITDSTTITKAGQKIALTDLNVGDTVRFQQTRQSDGSFTVESIEVVLP